MSSSIKPRKKLAFDLAVDIDNNNQLSIKKTIDRKTYEINVYRFEEKELNELRESIEKAYQKFEEEYAKIKLTQKDRIMKLLRAIAT